MVEVAFPEEARPDIYAQLREELTTAARGPRRPEREVPRRADKPWKRTDDGVCQAWGSSACTARSVFLPWSWVIHRVAASPRFTVSSVKLPSARTVMVVFRQRPRT